MPFTGVTIFLKRNTFDLLIGGYYIPTGIFAVLSMISYFIDPDVVPGRMGLLVTLFLISSNVYNSLDAPQGRGFSFIEIWLVGSQGPILLALIEYGCILAWKQHLSKSGSGQMDAKIKRLGLY